MSNVELKKRIKKKKRKNKRKINRDMKLRKLQQMIMKYVSKINLKIECCVFCGDKKSIAHFYTLGIFSYDYYICYNCYEHMN